MMYNEQTSIFVNGVEFRLVRASELSLDDDWLKYNPKTKREKEFMYVAKRVIRNGVSDFYRPTLDPSLDKEMRIYYCAGKWPAGDWRFEAWYRFAKKYCPERKSRLGTKSEYIAFLAVFIKELVASGKSLEWAWNAVCNDSKELGHYWNSSDAKHELEPTGNREVCGWRDLANTCKVLLNDNCACADYFWVAGGCYLSMSNEYPLADMTFANKNFCPGAHYSTGWIVLA